MGIIDPAKNRITPDLLLTDETLLSTANGYIGIRANFEEGYKEGYESIRGTYINGFYEDVDLSYSQNAYGFPQTAQKIVNVIDVQSIGLWIDGQAFSIFNGKLEMIDRHLSIEEGYAERKILWTSPDGKTVEITIRRMASFEKLELMLIDYKVKAINFSGLVRLSSMVKGEMTNYANGADSRVGSGRGSMLKVTNLQVNDGTIVMTARTARSGLSMTTAVAHNHEMTHEQKGHNITSTYEKNLKKGETLHLLKYAIFTDSIRHGHNSAIAEAYIKEALEHGADEWYRAQKDYLNHFWRNAKVEVKGDSSVEKALNYSVYQLLASSGKDGYSNISAKGLSGEGYQGHYFWDTEIYMMPFFTLTNHELAKELMRYRHTTLDASKKRARKLGHKKGAKIAWRTISGGECSGYFPSGTAQYHINADVAYSYLQYFYLSRDLGLMEEYGLEVLVETARLWLDVGNYNREGQFVINDVTGPDEYTAIVNNNFYTNAMAAYHLKGTVEVLNLIKANDITTYRRLLRRLNITDAEIQGMTHAASVMTLPYDAQLGIDVQDDSFLQKAPWDFDHTPRGNYPLLRHYHPLTLYRHQVLKQADTVLAHLLLDDRDEGVMKRSFDYYEGYTTHDSSLSPCVHAMMAARVGDVEKAYEYFMKTIHLDLDNTQGNTKDGLHIANAGGAYMSMVYGFGGFRIKPDGVSIRPVLPATWKGYTFRFLYGKVEVTVKVGKEVAITASAPITLKIYDSVYKQVSSVKVAIRG